MVDWMYQADASRRELRDLTELNQARFEVRLSASEARIDGRLSAFEARLDARFAEFLEALHADLAAMRLGIREMDTKFERGFNDLLKWSFVFWCGAVGAIAALAKVLH
jgi:hypothetical protein